MNRLTLAFTMAAVLALPGSGFTQDSDRGQRAPGQRAPGQQRERGQAFRGQLQRNADGPANPRMNFANRGQAGQPDAAMVVARLMKEFDADGDEKLDLKELTKLMTTMRERRQAGGQPGGPGGFRGGNADMENQGIRNRDMGNRETRSTKETRSTQNRRRAVPATGDQGGDKPIRPSDK